MAKLPDESEMGIEKDAILNLAGNTLPSLYTRDDDPAFRAKFAVLTAYRELLANWLTTWAEKRLSDLYGYYTAVHKERAEVAEPYREAWDESLSFFIENDMREVIDLLGGDVFEEVAGPEVRLHEVGRISEVAVELARLLAPSYADPEDADIGKYLARLGITSKDLKPLVDLAEKTPIPPRPLDPEPVVKRQEEPTPVEPEPEPPTRQELADAFAAWVQAANPDYAAYAIKLEVSPGTLRNYAAKKTLAKLNSAQAAILTKECDEAIRILTEARAVFSRVKPSGE